MLNERNAEILTLVKEGFTYAALGDMYSISRERVRVIANTYGVHGVQSHHEIRKRNKKLLKMVKKTCLEDVADVTGLTVNTVRIIVGKFGYSLREEKQRFWRKEMRPMVIRVKKGESIRSVCEGDHAMENRLNMECRRLGVASQHGRWGYRKKVASARA